MRAGYSCRRNKILGRGNYLQKPGIQVKGPHRGLFHPFGTVFVVLRTMSFLRAPNI